MYRKQAILGSMRFGKRKTLQTKNTKLELIMNAYRMHKWMAG